MVVVSDNSPLQYLILLGCADVLHALYEEVTTTPQVVEELSRTATPEAVRAWAAAPPAWLKIEAPATVRFLDLLDLGEASAISLAQERGADLVLIDERAGTETARGVGLRVVGTLGILIEAGLEGLIEFDPTLDRLVAETPFYATRRLTEAARRIFHERRKSRRR